MEQTGNLRLFTSESVSEGHPDKLADRISDAVLDALLEGDPDSRVAAETVCSDGLVLLAGEITTSSEVDFKSVARRVIRDVGYGDPEYSIDWRGCGVLVNYGVQSPDIARGVDASFDDPLDQGAGDQGLVFGYACGDTPELMPAAIALSHRLVRAQSSARRSGALPWLRPDAKSQVTLVLDEELRPVRVDAVVLSTQHAPEVSVEALREAVAETVIFPALRESGIPFEGARLFVNPTGRFVVGGPKGDCGLTGRKIIVDTYGGSAPHGGGAFSGKDPSKVDRSAAYAARHIAANVVAAGLARRCLVQVSYAIGVAKPVSVLVDTFGTGSRPDGILARVVGEVFDLRPRAIVERFGLKRPIYEQVSFYGHFGRPELDLPWERLDHVEALLSRLG